MPQNLLWWLCCFCRQVFTCAKQASGSNDRESAKAGALEQRRLFRRAGDAFEAWISFEQRVGHIDAIAGQQGL